MSLDKREENTENTTGCEFLFKVLPPPYEDMEGIHKWEHTNAHKSVTKTLMSMANTEGF